MQPAPMQVPQQTANPSSLHVSELEEFVTQEILWKQFTKYGNITQVKLYVDAQTSKHRGYAKVSFLNPQDATRARKELALTKLYNNEKCKKRMIIQENLPKDKLVEMQKQNLYITGVPELECDPQQIYTQMSKYGDIFSIQMPHTTGTKLSKYFHVIFYEKKIYDDLIKKAQVEVTLQGQNYTLKVEDNIAAEERQPKQVDKSCYFNGFYDQIAVKDFDTPEKTQQHQIKAQKLIEDGLSQYGQLKKVIVGYNDVKEIRQFYAFASFNKNEDMEKFVEEKNKDSKALFKKLGFQESTYINPDVNSKIGRSQDQDIDVLILNLQIKDTQEENNKLEEEFRQIVEDIVGSKPKDFFFKESKNPQTPQGQQSVNKLQDAKYCIISFQSNEDMEEFIISHQKYEKALKKFFLHGQVHGSVTIKLPSYIRKKIVRAKLQQKEMNQQQQRQQNVIQQFQMKQLHPQMQGQHFNRAFRGDAMQQGFNKRQPQRQHNRGQNQAGRQGPRPIQKQNPQQPNTQSQQPQQQMQNNVISQQPQQVTLEDLKQKLTQFTQIDNVKQQQILGNLLYPKVQALCKQKGYNGEKIESKITGMLIDFEVFEVADILETIENPDELDGRVQEAFELIEQQGQ